jgi:PKD repeat protein
MATNPVNNRVYLGNDGGIYYSQNNGTTWVEITAGLVISQAYKLGQSATVDDLVVNGYQDNGTSLMEGDVWKSIGGGDGMECAIDPTAPSYRYTTVYYGAINRVIGYNAKQIAGNGVNGITEEGAWVTPFIISENDPNTMFIGYKNIWRSRNIKNPSSSGVTWSKISTINTGNLDVLEQSAVNPEILYASSGGSLYICTNALQVNPTWINITSQLLSGSAISDIETSPFEENTVYIIQDKKIYKSLNKGSTWTDISGNLPAIHFSSIVYYKNSIEGLYVGSDAGVYYKDNSMTDWMLFSNGLPVAIKVSELEIFYSPASPAEDKIKASTFGRGLWKSDMYQTTPTVDFIADKTIVPTGCPVNFTDLSYGVPSQWNWSFPGATPATSNVKNPTGISYDTPGKYNVQLTASNVAGSALKVRNDYIIVSDTLKPQVGFKANPRLTCDLNTVVQLIDTSKYCPIGWVWTITPSTFVFENGTSANSQNPQVRFTSNGIYSVSLQSTNTNGSRTLSKSNYLIIGGYQAPYAEEFENDALDNKGWVIENPDNSITWELTTVDGNTPGNKAAWINFFNYSVPPGRRDRMISPPLNFTGTTPLFMTFEHAYANRFTTVSDSLIVLISDDCGSTWVRLFAAGEKGAGTLATVQKQTTPFTPSVDDDWCSGGWGSLCNIINLTEWANKPNIRIAFESYNRNGNNLFIDNIKIAGTPNVGIKTSANQKILVYPNPSKGFITLFSGQPIEDLSVSLINIQGSVVYHQMIKSNSNLSELLNLSMLSKGVYLMKIQGNSTLQQEKIIIR